MGVDFDEGLSHGIEEEQNRILILLHRYRMALNKPSLDYIFNNIINFINSEECVQ